MDFQKNENNNGSLLHDIALKTWKHKRVFITIVFITTSLSIVYALLLQEIFSTQTVFITKTGNSNNPSLSDLASLAGISIGGASSNVNPSDYLDKVVQDKEFLLHIINKKWYYMGDSIYLNKLWKIKPDSTKDNWSYRFEKAKLDFARSTGAFGISKDRRTGTLSLNVNTPDPQMAFDINNYIITMLSDYIRNSIKTQAKEKRVFIETRIKEIKLDLEQNENALAIFKERNIATVSPKATIEEMRLMRAITLSQELYIQFQKQYEIAKVEELNDQTLIQIIQSPEIPIERSKPNRRKIVVIGFMLGCIIGSLFCYLVLERKKVE